MSISVKVESRVYRKGRLPTLEGIDSGSRYAMELELTIGQCPKGL
jgi:hypothetical protein